MAGEDESEVTRSGEACQEHSDTSSFDISMSLAPEWIRAPYLPGKYLATGDYGFRKIRFSRLNNH